MLRKIDELGRVVLPWDYRKAMNIHEKDEVEVIMSSDEIIIKKPIWGCCFCGTTTNLVRIGDNCLCRSCINRLHAAKDGDVLYPVQVKTENIIQK